jgi:choline dehydrogenase-like flavoprotein
MSSKRWMFTVGMGGGSNAWWAQTPRFLPEDFALRTTYGVGVDWPVSYAELASDYDEAEGIIGVAGDRAMPYPTTNDFPQPPHLLSDFDRAMQRAFPNSWFIAPTARSSTGTARRGRCLAAGHCGLCPVDAKFRIMNEMAELYTRPNVTVITGAEVRSLDLLGGSVSGVVWRDREGRDHIAKGDTIFLGLNAVFNATTLLRTGVTHPLLGKRLNEQMGVKIAVELADVDSFNGSTQITGLGYMFYAGPHRSTHAATLIEHQNAPPRLRLEKGKLRKRAILKLVYENMPDDGNYITLQDDFPLMHYTDHSAYAKRAHATVPRQLAAMLDRTLGIDGMDLGHIEPSEGHICGGTSMSASPATGIVDAQLRHHAYRNLLLGGSGVFPTSPPSNPSLTIAALSLRAARML